MTNNLTVTHIAKEFPTRGDALVVLRDASLELSAGENTAILGPSGSGKSTLLHIIGTLERPTTGSVELDGQSPFSMDERGLADFRNAKIGFVFQDHHLLPQLSVLENVLLPTIAHGAADKSTVERAHELLEKVGLSQRLDHRPGELSGGERQRVAIARSIVMEPGILLADEPTGNLDSQSGKEIVDIMEELNSQGLTLIVVTHDPAIGSRATRQLRMEDGRVVADVRSTQPAEQGA